MMKDVGLKLVLSLLAGHVHAQIVLPKVWEQTPALVVSGLIYMYTEDNSSLSRILDIAQDLKVIY